MKSTVARSIALWVAFSSVALFWSAASGTDSSGDAATPALEGAPASALAGLAGAPAVIEFPTLEDFEQPLPGVPNGWGYLQVGADDRRPLRQELDIELDFVIVFVDRHGNVLHQDSSPKRRRRVAQGVREFERRRREILGRLRESEQKLEVARRKGRESQEVELLRRIHDLGLRGYPEVERAEQRRAVIETDRWERLLRILAEEGLVSSTVLQSRLKALEQISEGLAVAERIRRERSRLQQGVVVEGRDST